MKTVRHYVLKSIRPLAFFFLALFLIPSTPMPNTFSFAGIWEGTLQLQDQDLSLVFDIQKKGGLLNCELEIPSLEIKGIPADQVLANEQELQINYLAFNAQYYGFMDQNGQQINGVWSQNGASLDLTLTKKQREEIKRERRHNDPKIGAILAKQQNITA